MYTRISVLMLFASLFILSSCATMFGGSRYNATVQVANHPKAKIMYKGEHKGTGEATFKVKRKEADEFTITIQEEGCEAETKEFTKKTFRGWSLVGSIVMWTGLVNGIPLPWGVVLDEATGSWWKPSVKEEGVVKENFNNYIYTVPYNGCPEE